MKKLLILSLFLVSCRNDDVTISKKEYDKLRGVKVIAPEYPKLLKVTDVTGKNIELYNIIIDSCEYISSWSLYSNAAVLSHRGRCKFCQQRLEATIRKTLEEQKQTK